MAPFNPDAFLGVGAAPAPAAAGFDPDAFLGAPAPAVEEPEKEEPGFIASGLRGVKQGLTMGFGDEIAGALESAFTTKTYKQARDEARAKDKEAQDAHGLTFGLGQILGGVATTAIPGAGLAKLGTGLAGSIARGAATGIATGAGESEAEDAEGIVKDAAKGGLVGGAAGAVGHGLSRILGGAKGVVAGAPERADSNLADSLLEKVPARTQDKALAQLGEREGLATLIRSDKALSAAASKGPAELLDVVQRQADDVGSQIGKIYQAADQVSDGVPLSKVTGALKELHVAAEAGFDAPAAGAIQREIDALERMAKGRELVKASDVHGLVKRYGRAGFSGGDFANPSDARILGREMNGAVRQVLQDHVDDVAAAHPGLATTAHLKDLNKQFSKLSALEDLADSQATRATRNAPNLKERLEPFAKLSAGATALASGSFAPVAAYAAYKGAPVMGRAATNALARLVRAARAGSGTARLVEDALATGVPRATVQATVAKFSRPDVDAE